MINPVNQYALDNHAVFNEIKNVHDLKKFMSWHVFAVWDFMCLVKRLHRELTSDGMLWVPPATPEAARLINEILLSEESDDLPNGGTLSHFEIYLLAMKEVGADTTQIEEFISLIKYGADVNDAFEQLNVHPCVQEFVNSTLGYVEYGNVFEVLGSFFFGREHCIPKMFTSLLESWHIDEQDAPMFVYYLKRHIEVDGDKHGPAAMKIIDILTHNDPVAASQLEGAAEDAIKCRIELWDGLLEHLKQEDIK